MSRDYINSLTKSVNRDQMVKSLFDFILRGFAAILELWRLLMDKERRRTTRHACEASVGYATQDLSFIDYIHDINSWGVFIQSKQKVPVGESILMTIPLFGDETSIKVVGEVVWSSPEGMGVRFSMGIGDAAVDSILGRK